MIHRMFFPTKAIDKLAVVRPPSEKSDIVSSALRLFSIISVQYDFLVEGKNSNVLRLLNKSPHSRNSYFLIAVLPYL